MLSESSEHPGEFIQNLTHRLQEAEEILRALRSGEVDAIVTSGPAGDRVYTLQGADEPYRLMMQEMAEGALTLSPQGLVLFSNERFAEMVKAPLERVIGCAIHNFVAREDLGLFSALLSRSSDGRAKGELRLQAERGEVVPAYLSLSRVRIGTLECVCAIVTDLTEQKRNEEIVAAEKLARSILEQAAEAILVVDLNGKIIRASRSADRLAGMTALLGDFDELFHICVSGAADFSYQGLLAQTMRVQRIENIEATALGRGGRADLLLSAALLQDAASRPIGCVVSLIDITERKAIENRLRETQKLESIGQLAGGIAHDFNNLMVSVIGNASLAKDLLPENSDAVQLLANVVKAGEQAAHLTSQLLAYSGKGQFLIEPVNLSELVREVRALLQPVIAQQIEIRLDVAPEVPAIEADRGQLQQLVMNLALNAAEAIGDNAGLISVQTGVQDIDGRSILHDLTGAKIMPGVYVTLEVRDTGCGMDEFTKARILDPFFTTKFLGRGLGLAAVGGIVRSHKGALIVQSTPGEGAHFTVLFPASDRPAAVSAPENLRETGAILVVDDEEVVRMVAKRTLERCGFTVLLADSARAAINVFKSEPSKIAAVLLDLSMPGMTGGEALPVLLKIRPRVKVIVSSGYGEDEAMKSFSGSPVSAFLQKPYTGARLAQKVKAAVA